MTQTSNRTTPKINIEHLFFSYNTHSVLEDVNAQIQDRCITAITGPSGQGKSTLLTVLNRLWETVPGARMSGKVQIRLDEAQPEIQAEIQTDTFTDAFIDIYGRDVRLPELRRQVAMVFQVPNPLPMSIYKNAAFGLKLKGGVSRQEMDEKVETALKRAFLFDEVKDRLDEDARVLSGGQQQRLCIARSLVLDPQVFLLDEPTSSLDETSGRIIEDLLLELKKDCALVLVSHSSDQVRRVAGTALHMSDKKLKQLF